MIKCLVALSAILPGLVAAATVWTWVDENGRRHYSDREVPGATRIEIGDTQTFSGSALTQGASTTPSNPSSDPENANPAALYSVFEVTSPEPEATLRNIEGSMTVQLATYPALATEHQIDLVFDGARRNLNSRSLQISLDSVYRGEHTLQAVVIDAAGTVVQRSEPVRFFVQQTSTVLSPAMQGRGAAPASNAGAGSQ